MEKDFFELLIKQMQLQQFTEELLDLLDEMETEIRVHKIKAKILEANYIKLYKKINEEKESNNE